MRIAELMQPTVITVAADAKIAHATRILVQAHVSALPVLDRDGRPIGVLTTKDVLRAETEREPSGTRRWLFDMATARDIMSPWPATIDPDADVQEAAA